uniref:Uncharacterized protein n=1 Tax=Peronospora matthiolae TaxID=2874970 RepID=A0AAV1UGV1_9STRA
MKCTALAVTALVAVASVASATDYQPALRALAASEPATPSTDTMAAGPTERHSHPVEAAADVARKTSLLPSSVRKARTGPTERHSHPVEAAADVAAENEPTAVIGAEGKKSKELYLMHLPCVRLSWRVFVG